MKALKLLRRWMNMLFGKSQFHVEQGRGKCYSLSTVKGYYNDLTNKVSDKKILFFKRKNKNAVFFKFTIVLI